MNKLLLSQKSKTCQRQLNFFYEKPDPLNSYEQWVRFVHDDLNNMTTALLKREQSRLKLRLLYDGEPTDWFLQRLERIRALLK